MLRISSDPLSCLLKRYHISLAVFTQTVNSFEVVRIFGLLLRSSSIGAVFVSSFSVNPHADLGSLDHTACELSLMVDLSTLAHQ